MRFPRVLGEPGRDTGPIEYVTRHSSPILTQVVGITHHHPGVGLLAPPTVPGRMTCHVPSHVTAHFPTGSRTRRFA